MTTEGEGDPAMPDRTEALNEATRQIAGVRDDLNHLTEAVNYLAETQASKHDVLQERRSRHRWMAIIFLILAAMFAGVCINAFLILASASCAEDASTLSSIESCVQGYITGN